MIRGGHIDTYHDSGGGTSIHIMIRKSKYQKYRYMPKNFDKYPYPGRDPLAGVVAAPLLSSGLQRILPLRPLPEAAPPPSTGWLPGELRGGSIVEKMPTAEGRGSGHVAQ